MRKAIDRQIFGYFIQVVFESIFFKPIFDLEYFLCIELIELISFLEILLNRGAILKIIGYKGVFRVEALTQTFIEVKLHILGVNGVVTGLGIIFV